MDILFRKCSGAISFATIAGLFWIGLGIGAEGRPVIRTGPGGRETRIERSAGENGGVNTTFTGPRGRQTGSNFRFENGRAIRTTNDGRQISIERERDGDVVNTTRTGPNGRQTRYSTTRDGRGNATRTFENGNQVDINRRVENGRLFTTRTGPNDQSRTWRSEVENGQVIHTGPGGRRWSIRRR